MIERILLGQVNSVHVIKVSMSKSVSLYFTIWSELMFGGDRNF